MKAEKYLEQHKHVPVYTWMETHKAVLDLEAFRRSVIASGGPIIW